VFKTAQGARPQTKETSWGRVLKPQGLNKRIPVGSWRRGHCLGVSPGGYSPRKWPSPADSEAPQGQSRSSWGMNDLIWDGRGKGVSNQAKARPRNNNNNRKNNSDRNNRINNMNNKGINKNNRFLLLRRYDFRHASSLPPRKTRQIDRHGRAHKVFFAHARQWRTPKNHRTGL
jgi:hypothetical protein